MSSKLQKEIDSISKMIEKIKLNQYYESVVEDDKDFRKLNWETQLFCKGILLSIQKKVPDYAYCIETNQLIFLEDLDYSQNRIAYDEDLNLLIEYSPKEIIEKFLKITRKINEEG